MAAGVARRLVLISLLALGAILLLLSFFRGLPPRLTSAPAKNPHPPPALPRHPIYKPTPTPAPPIVENFPLAAAALSPSDLPPIPSWNTPPSQHVKESTPLLIGFTRNWLLLQQTVVSYITAGWPPEDIYVVENTGTMNANRLSKLTLQNPFYLDYQRLTNIFGVNVISTPTLFTFAQLQNFFLYTAIEKEWEHYFWGHMDVAALSPEDWHGSEGEAEQEYMSLYMRSVDDLRKTLESHGVDAQGRTTGWAIKFYAYDRLALVNRFAFEQAGGWDTLIPFYGTDCDMHERLTMAGQMQTDGHVGLVFDIGSSLKDLRVLYRRQPQETEPSLESIKSLPEDTRASPEYIRLRDQFNSMQVDKNSGDRNTWQASQQGGQGEPYYRDAPGFEKGTRMWMEFGKEVMNEKWGHRGCNIRGVGLSLGDAWRVEHDWDRPK